MGDLAEKQGRNWGMACHLIALCGFVGVPFGNIIGPLVIWLIKKDEFPFVDSQGKESLNFQISMTIYALISALLILAFIGFILVPAVIITDVILVVVATVAANKGEAYRYPITIQFIK